MIITAKYPGTCPACGERFAAGTNVNWAKGRKAMHAVCPSAQEAAADAAVGAYVAEGLGETRDFISDAASRVEASSEVSLADLPF